MNVLMVATVHGLAGSAAELRAELTELRAAAVAQPGCTTYHVGELLDSPGDFVITADYVDEPALRAHYASAAYSRYSSEAGALLARPSDAVLHYVASTVRPQGDASADPTRQG